MMIFYFYLVCFPFLFHIQSTISFSLCFPVSLSLIIVVSQAFINHSRKSFLYICVCVCVCVYKTFLVSQMVKNLPAMQEIQVPSPGRKDPREKEKVGLPSRIPQYSCLENSRQRSLAGHIPGGHKESNTTD